MARMGETAGTLKMTDQTAFICITCHIYCIISMSIDQIPIDLNCTARKLHSARCMDRGTNIGMMLIRKI